MPHLTDERDLLERTVREAMETSSRTAADLARAMVPSPGDTMLTPFVKAQEAVINGGTKLAVDAASEIGKYLICAPIRALSFGAGLAMKGLLPEVAARSGMERER